MLSKETLKELSAILSKDYGRNYTDKEVFEVAQGIVGLFDWLIALDFKDKNENNDETKRLHKTIPERAAGT